MPTYGEFAPQRKVRHVDNDPLMTMGEASKTLDVVPASVRRFVDTGVLPSLRTMTGVRLVRKSDVDALAAARASQTTRRGSLAALSEPVGATR